jgi:hypothetical protein
MDGYYMKKKSMHITSRLNLNTTLGTCFVVWKRTDLTAAVWDLTKKRNLTFLFQGCNLKTMEGGNGSISLKPGWVHNSTWDRCFLLQCQILVQLQRIRHSLGSEIWI